MFYSELTDKYYPTAKECVAAEDEFKNEQLKQAHEMEELKKQAEAAAAKEEAAKKRAEQDKVFAQCEEAFDNVATAIIEFAKLAKKFYGLLPADTTFLGIRPVEVMEYLDDIIVGFECDESEDQE